MQPRDLALSVGHEFFSVCNLTEHICIWWCVSQKHKMLSCIFIHVKTFIHNPVEHIWNCIVFHGTICWDTIIMDQLFGQCCKVPAVWLHISFKSNICIVKFHLISKHSVVVPLRPHVRAQVANLFRRVPILFRCEKPRELGVQPAHRGTGMGCGFIRSDVYFLATLQLFPRLSPENEMVPWW